MVNVQDYLQARDEYIRLLKTELLGPGSEITIPDAEHELITNPPDVRYSVGILFPRNNKLNADNDDSARVEESSEEGNEIDSESDDREERTEALNDIDLPAEEDNLDEEIGLAAQNMPSSFGITFLASGETEKIQCHIKFATYRHALVPDCRIPFSVEDPENFVVPQQFKVFASFDKEEGSLKLSTNITRKDVALLKEEDNSDEIDSSVYNAMYKLADQLRGGFVRIPHEVNTIIDFASAEYVDNNRELDGTKAKLTALRREVSPGIYSVTVMMVNDDEKKSTATRCIFQPELIIDSAENGFVFREFSALTDFNRLNEEEKSLELQYRNKKVFASGLGTSVCWEINEAGNGTVRNDFFPESEVPMMDFSIPPKYDLQKSALSMRFLSDFDKTSKQAKIDCLNSLVSAYGKWIVELEDKTAELEEKYKETAKRNIQGCRNACDRMQSGVKTLLNNDNAWTAFELANRAMFMQRVHLKLQEKMSSVDRFPGDEEVSDFLENLDYREQTGLTQDLYIWRPFQLAFLLMSIDSIVNEKCKERDIVDLIWFPTGGGKTEAYLGLTAFTIFFRRLSHAGNADGTAVIMRYTLRLLAAQQFTRASTLICACEFIRQDATSRRPVYGKYPLGSEEINIGLWIGHEHIPNTNNEAKSHLKKLNEATVDNLHFTKEQHNKFQLLKCPWCGTKMVKETIKSKMIGSFGYRIADNRHFELFCPQESCSFTEKLPIQIIDEELYRKPPTLLFGTVDKFAMIPWKKDIGSFFGADNDNRPPDLIIQDELHLISGPLGTMVGLYETVLDELCERNGIRPKIVASTATIRRAKEQCAALYNRDVSQFPHPGLDSDDSFFARESKIEYNKGVYGRKYIGLMPSGKTKAMMEVRSIAALMQKINIMELPDEIKDKYWTLTVYFNSLRDLGKCATLVDDDVKDFIKRTAYRLGDARDARKIARADELTSRVTTTHLNETLDKLEKLNYSQENIENKRYASNILLATNMISVGIDVARLNVMLLVGQPKLTSEYIQASSRIGRSFPGVAFAMYDGSKSRDRSHYEQFKAYHDSFYRFVEPTGATPFSKPARGRSLHAVVIAMLRMLEPDLMKEKGAANFKREVFSQRIIDVSNHIIERAVSVTQRVNPDMLDESSEITEEINYILEKWEQLAENYDKDHFCYGERFMFSSPDDNDGRLLKPYGTSRNDPAFDTMTSMRNVDSAVKGNILVWEEEA